MINKLINAERSIAIKEEITRIKNLNPLGFEGYVANLFKLLGFLVEQTPPTNDGGKDVVATKDNEVYYIECKHFTDGPVGREIVQKAYGACAIDGANGCYVVTSSHFNQNAIDCAKKNRNIHLLDLYDIAYLNCYLQDPMSVASDEEKSYIKRLEGKAEIFNKILRTYEKERRLSPRWIQFADNCKYDINNSKNIWFGETELVVCCVQEGAVLSEHNFTKYIIDTKDSIYATVSIKGDINQNSIKAFSEGSNISALAKRVQKTCSTIY